MTAGASAQRGAQPVNDTLRWIAAGYRGLAWVWMMILVFVEAAGGGAGDSRVLAGAAGLATVWLGVTVWAAGRAERLASPWFVLTDGVVALGLSMTGWLAGAGDFVSGGWPGSWLFMVAFAANVWWTLSAGLVLVTAHVALHVLHGLPAGRTAGSFQFITLALVVGWAFDSLRHREALRLAAETELAKERDQVARHEERTRLAVRLHDSVLQTLYAIKVGAKEPDQVRYLTRRQERELRRTIEEFRSPHEQSFRAHLLRYRDEVEELCQQVEISDVIRDDTQLTPRLAVALRAAREAMLNAAKHSGCSEISLYSEIDDGEALIHIRDRGVGFDLAGRRGQGMNISMIHPVEQAGGEVTVDTSSGAGTEVTIRMLSR